MNAEQLSKVGSDLVRRCGTRDPFQIANALGINVMDDCENLGSLKGMYCIVKRNRFIFLNKDLSPQMKRIVCAHEIGHDRLHRALAKKHGLQKCYYDKINFINEYVVRSIQVYLTAKYMESDYIVRNINYHKNI